MHACRNPSRFLQRHLCAGVLAALSQETQLLPILLGQADHALHLLVVNTQLAAELLDDCVRAKAAESGQAGQAVCMVGGVTEAGCGTGGAQHVRMQAAELLVCRRCLFVLLLMLQGCFAGPAGRHHCCSTARHTHLASAARWPCRAAC